MFDFTHDPPGNHLVFDSRVLRKEVNINELKSLYRNR